MNPLILCSFLHIIPHFQPCLSFSFSNSIFLIFTVYVFYLSAPSCFCLSMYLFLCLFILLFNHLTVYLFICPYFVLVLVCSYLCPIFSILVLLAGNQLIKRTIQTHLMVKVSNFIKSIDLLFNLDKVI